MGLFFIFILFEFLYCWGKERKKGQNWNAQRNSEMVTGKAHLKGVFYGLKVLVEVCCGAIFS